MLFPDTLKQQLPNLLCFYILSAAGVSSGSCNTRSQFSFCLYKACQLFQEWSYSSYSTFTSSTICIIITGSFKESGKVKHCKFVPLGSCGQQGRVNQSKVLLNLLVEKKKATISHYMNSTRLKNLHMLLKDLNSLGKPQS